MYSGKGIESTEIGSIYNSMKNLFVKILENDNKNKIGGFGVLKYLKQTRINYDLNRQMQQK